MYYCDALLSLARVDIIQILYSVRLRLYCICPLRLQVWIHCYYNDEGYDGDLNMLVT
jgi:hypothetical protein